MVTVAKSPRSVIPPGYEQHPCSQCRCLILVRADTPEAPICRQCCRGEALRDISKAAETFRALRKAEAPFDVLSPQERAEQLAAMLVDENHLPPAPIRAAMATLSNAQLVDIVASSTDMVILAACVAELAKRIDGEPGAPLYTSTAADAPTPEERDEIETHIEVVPDGDTLDAERWDGLS